MAKPTPVPLNETSLAPLVFSTDTAQLVVAGHASVESLAENVLRIYLPPEDARALISMASAGRAFPGLALSVQGLAVPLTFHCTRIVPCEPNSHMQIPLRRHVLSVASPPWRASTCMCAAASSVSPAPVKVRWLAVFPVMTLSRTWPSHVMWKGTDICRCPC